MLQLLAQDLVVGWRTLDTSRITRWRSRTSPRSATLARMVASS